MSSDISTTMRARRVVFDDFNKAFSVESRVEALQRQVETRSKLTNVLNRSQECKLDYSKGKVEAARGIFTRKSDSEMDLHRHSLKDYVAHRELLDKFARMNRRKGLSSALGKYGIGTAKVEIQPMINKRVKDATPSAIRRREAKKLVRRRKKVHVWDRTLDTPDLLNAGKDNVKNSRQNTQIRGNRHSVTLPSVKKLSSSTADSPPNKGTLPSINPQVDPIASDLTLPSVFLTQSPSKPDYSTDYYK
ncbi:hypothetical protein LOTGIDRAFT_173922 [Lottia gigantea]|uniref:Uncharacterized protein n=1 Tax=Lottia gigantea TaxID=225164 RepID=V4APJ8_LOTGI|nr:hypothetical protein LOTGIDRAFT_173922 [Lottia gigantea]ESO99127.1 hypothetical protein LOTGIDRAFT_173922 [Lottia gigantea]